MLDAIPGPGCSKKLVHDWSIKNLPCSEPMWPIEARNAAIANTYFVGANNRVGTVSGKGSSSEEAAFIFAVCTCRRSSLTSSHLGMGSLLIRILVISTAPATLPLLMGAEHQ